MPVSGITAVLEIRTVGEGDQRCEREASVTAGSIFTLTARVFSAHHEAQASATVLSGTDGAVTGPRGI